MFLISSLKGKSVVAALALAAVLGCLPVQAVVGQDQKPPAKAPQANPTDFTDDFAGFRFTKPDRAWSIYNNGPEAIHQIACSANENDRWSPRFAIIVMPSITMPDGMETRLRQVKISYADPKQSQPFEKLEHQEIQASRLHITKFEKASIAGREATLLTYDLDEEKPYRSVEYGLFFNDNFYLIQAAAPVSEWEKPELVAMFERAFKSFTFLKPKR